jgi:hypothetical protein
MEAGSSNTVAVTPGRAHFHASSLKSWAYVTYAAGAPTLATNSYNIASISDVATGILGVTIANDHSTTSFSAVCTTGSTSTNTNDGIAYEHNNLRTAGFVQFQNNSSAGAAIDPAAVSVMTAGDL